MRGRLEFAELGVRQRFEHRPPSVDFSGQNASAKPAGAEKPREFVIHKRRFRGYVCREPRTGGKAAGSRRSDIDLMKTILFSLALLLAFAGRMPAQPAAVTPPVAPAARTLTAEQAAREASGNNSSYSIGGSADNAATSQPVSANTVAKSGGARVAPAVNTSAPATGTVTVSTGTAVVAQSAAADAAEASDPNSPFAQGLKYYKGDGAEQDYDKAFAYFKKAAAAGSVRALDYIGYMYAHGYGVEKNSTKAVAWYQKAADKGSSAALANLGRLYLNGDGVDTDYDQAASYFRKAAQLGNPTGMDLLGYVYENGLGVKADISQARQWYQKAADAGSESAVKNLKALGQ